MSAKFDILFTYTLKNEYIFKTQILFELIKIVFVVGK